MNILVTGGAGYIGSHTIIELVDNGHKVVVVDNLANSKKESIKNVEAITGSTIDFYDFDVRDRQQLPEIFDMYHFDAVMHFAGLKAVGESVKNPIEYYETNINTTIALLKVMNEFNVKKLIFSSSATVYGAPSELPLKETSIVGQNISNPYGQTKYMIEQMLKDCAVADPSLEISILRYFNPIGAHPSGLIGEDPSGTPNNLLPFLAQVAVGRIDTLNVYGDDYATKDGSGVRDYIHVVDLARGHVAALNNIKKGVSIYNLGVGQGVSVFEMIDAFEKASNTTIKYNIVQRRAGDIDECIASAEKANKELAWSAKKTINDACVDVWRWQSSHPNGFDED